MVALQRDRTPSDEIVDFLLSRPTPQEVIDLHASDSAQERLRYLLDGNRNNTLNDAERAELDMYIQFDNLIAKLKVRAFEMLDTQS